MKAINTHITQTSKDEKQSRFLCPKDGLIDRFMVTFLCNRCKSSEMIYVDDMYVCPKCLTGSNSFQCRICDSVEVIHIERGQ